MRVESSIGHGRARSVRCCPRLLAQSSESLVLQAEQEFQQGLQNKTRPMLARPSFSEATDRYRELHQRGVRCPELYLNLGNAALLADRWPEALWAYHMGLKLDPNDALIAGTSGFRARAKRYIPRPDMADRKANPGRPESIVRQWGCWPPVLGLHTFWHGWPPPWRFCGANLRRVFIAILAALIAATAGFGLWHGFEQADVDRQTPLIILKEKTWLYRGNGVNYPLHPELPLLGRGMEARQVHRRGAWLQIRLTSEEIGWVPLSHVLVVEP